MSNQRFITFDFVIIYFMLLLFYGYYFCEFWTTPAVIVTGSLLLYKIKKLYFLKSNIIIIFTLLVINILSTEVIASFKYACSPPIKLTILMIVVWMLALCYAQETNLFNFRQKYVDCMFVIASVSVVAYFIFIVDPVLFEGLPRLINSNNREGFFLIFTVVSDFSMTGAHRNQGIFWEPGAFQAFLCLAYIFEVSNDEEKTRKYVLFVLILAIITTFSTVGLIIAVLLIGFTFCRVKEPWFLLKVVTVILILVILICVLLPRLTGYWEYALIKKLELVLNYQPGVTTESSSRVDSVIYPLLEWLNHPLLGIGNSGFIRMSEKVGHSMFTCTPVNWIVEYGIIYASIVYIGLFKFFNKLYTLKLEAIAITIIFLLSISTEALQGSIIFFIICFLGYMDIKPTIIKENKKDENSND